MDFKTRLKELREINGLTQKDLANELNYLLNTNKIYPQTISYWENGREPNLQTVVQLANYFNVPTDYLLGNTDKLDFNEISYDETFKTILNKKKLDKLLVNLPNNLKSSFFDMFNTHIYALELGELINENKELTDYHLDYIYLLNQFDKLFINYQNKILASLISTESTNRNENIKLSKTLNYNNCKEINSISINTIKSFTTLLDELNRFLFKSLETKDYKSIYKDSILSNYKNND
ncbi:helix-turn-helix domain-containing protein [Clostridium perfringens]